MALTPFGRRGVVFVVVLLLAIFVVPALLQGQSSGIHLAAAIVAVAGIVAALVYWFSLLWES